MTDVHIQYRFEFPDDPPLVFDILFDNETLKLTKVPAAEPPAWAVLGFHQCPNCPLGTGSTPHCPLALRLVDLVEGLGRLVSHDLVELEVVTAERTIRQGTTVQRGASAMMGVIAALSDCPHMAFFQPMARFHLPLASEEETIFRATGMYLLAQYYRGLEGHTADIGLDGLVDIYRNVQVVNRALSDRLRAASESDSTVNALILLDLYAKSVPSVIEESLEELRPLFSRYLARGEWEPPTPQIMPVPGSPRGGLRKLA